MNDTTANAWARPVGLVRHLIEWWAVFGGAVLVAVVSMATWSVISAALWGKPFAGDYELTELGVAITAFAFLPYCQLTGANVTADIFTSRASPRFIAFMGLVTSVVAFGFALILLRQMTLGMIDQRYYRYITAVLAVPKWYAFVPILISLTLLAVAALITGYESVRAMMPASRADTAG